MTDFCKLFIFFSNLFRRNRTEQNNYSKIYEQCGHDNYCLILNKNYIKFVDFLHIFYQKFKEESYLLYGLGH